VLAPQASVQSPVAFARQRLARQLALGQRVEADDATAAVLRNFPTVFDWNGAFTDGATDSSAAFQAAALSGEKCIVVPKIAQPFILDDILDIQSGQTWLFMGADLRTTDDTLTAIIRANNKDDWSICGALNLRGTLVSSGTAAETGLLVIGGKRFNVSNVVAQLFKGHGFRVEHDGADANHGYRGTWSNIAAHECVTGIEVQAGTAAEYNTFASVIVRGCVDGINVGAGNTFMAGGVVTDCDRGIVLVGGSNHGHGCFSAMGINHNDVNVEAASVSLGHRFVGCDFYGDSASLGKILLTNSRGVSFTDCDIDCRIENNIGAGTSNGLNRVRGVTAPGARFNLAGDDLINLRISDVYDFAGQLPALCLSVQPVLVGAFSGTWVNYGATRNAAGYYLDDVGDVCLQGVIKDGTINTAAFTLPAGLRPDKAVEHIVNANGAAGFLHIDTAGVVTPISGDPSKFSLEGVRFRAKT